MFECKECNLCETKGKKYARGIGNLKADLMIITDSPSRVDSDTGFPLSSQNHNGTGDDQLLVRMLARIGLERKDAFTTCLVNCAPPLDEKYKPTKLTDPQVQACMRHLNSEVSYVKPKVIITMGALAAKYVAKAKSIGSVQGRVVDSAEALCFDYARDPDIPAKESTKKGVKVQTYFNKKGVFGIVPTYPFSMARRNPDYMAPLERAFDKAGALLQGKVPEEVKYDYRFAYTEPEVYKMLQEVLKRCDTEDRLFFDIETTGLNWFPALAHNHVSQLISCGFGFQEHQVYGTMLRPGVQRSVRVMKVFRKIMEHPIKKSGHGGKFDNVFIRGEFGYVVVNYDFDTMLAAWQLKQGSPVGLGDLSPIYRPDLGYYWESIEKKYLDTLYGYAKAPDDELLVYNCRDVDVTATLHKLQEAELKKRGMWKIFNEITMPHVRALEDVQFHGVKIDVPAAKALGSSKLKDLEYSRGRIFELTERHPEGLKKDELEKMGLTEETYKPFNPNSVQQVGRLLYDDMKRKCYVFTKEKNRSTSEEALMYHKDVPWVQALLDYKSLLKQLSTYLGWGRDDDGNECIKVKKKDSAALLWIVGKDHRVHTSFNVHGTATGRISSSGPNLQNIPKTAEFRNLFIPEDGYFFGDCDYASLELRILGLLSKDPALIKVFTDGLDLHSATGAGISGLTLADFEGVDYYPDPANKETFEHFEDQGDLPAVKVLNKKYPEAAVEQIFVRKDRKERKAGKIINFGIVYGKGPASLADDLDITKPEAEQYLAGWAKTYAGAWAWIRQRKEELQRTGIIAYSMGRERPLPEVWSDDKGVVGGAYRQCINTPVQGTGADCTSTSVIRVNNRLAAELGAENARVVLEIHDQLVVEGKLEYRRQIQDIVVTEMQRQMPFIGNEIELLADYEEVDKMSGKALEPLTQS